MVKRPTLSSLILALGAAMGRAGDHNLAKGMAKAGFTVASGRLHRRCVTGGTKFPLQRKVFLR